MSAPRLLNFLVLQWFGVRLARWYVKVPDVTVSEFGRLLERTLMRWIWPLTGWWSDYRWISGARRRR
jgi:hypothetical protein